DLIRSDPQGPIPKPQLPAYDAPAGETGEAGPILPAEQIKYKVKTSPDDQSAVTELFQKTAELYTLADKPVLNSMTLTRRLRSSLEKGRQILQSLGYYDGQVTGWLEKKDGSEEVLAVINFQLGPVYHLGKSQVLIYNPAEHPADQPADPAAAPAGNSPAETPGSPSPPAPVRPQVRLQDPDPPPTADLTEAGWVSGQPALADNVQNMAAQNTELWNNRGYPKARLFQARYFLDKENKLLNAEISIEPGEFVLMGPMEVSGETEVEVSYMENLKTWKDGEKWNQSQVTRFVEAMFQTGLFRTVETAMGDPDENGRRPVLVTVADAPQKTISGSVNFDSDFGPGVVIGWEHRNFTGRGDRLRLELPAWTDLLQLGATYIRPYFLSPRQNLLLDLAVLHEKADAYTLSAVSSAAGLERQLTRRLSALIQLRLEAGYLEEFGLSKTNYRIYGVPLTLSWDYTDDLLNATRGSRLKISVQPYIGNYFDEFRIVKSRLDLSHYFPIMKEGKLVLALRGAAGGIWGAERTAYPATLRFFGGGGGSMRGYEYQSVGPRSARDKPDGGGAMAEVSGEVRWRWTESLGAVIFVDGGMVYDRPDLAQIGQSFLWGGGVGFRYYTPIGPFRLDLASPLTPRDRDDPLQFYLSLGQSF
ncbi:MAG: BamA/TamA family outer membrane protein, partial [Deltaproteobacteria bacterium]|nr:BamA/TamA family outer membrane protein [Deltaproteobacteria bacterium]